MADNMGETVRMEPSMTTAAAGGGYAFNPSDNESEVSTTSATNNIDVGMSVAQCLLAACYKNPPAGKCPREGAHAILRSAMKLVRKMNTNGLL